MPAAVAVPAAISVAGMGLSAIQGMSAQEDAKKLAEEQQKQNQQAESFAEQQFLNQQNLYNPIRKELIKENTAVTPEIYNQQANILNRQLGNFNREALASPASNSGVTAALLRGGQMNLNSNLAAAYNQAKIQQQNNLMRLLGEDQSNQWGANVMRSKQGLSDMYGKQAGIAGASAAEAYGNLQKGMSGLGSSLGNYFGSKSSAPVTTVTQGSTPTNQTNPYLTKSEGDF